ncbi:hypothetical protein ALC57_07044 [Trachymyrmex cornetzi]|uniref:Uncharacterized protein n=1 Tax=Trachymyrmex cornetzi TaxID=471704 RepID=A0A195E5T3_9HYME|nr:hypothetical protein ALC57_07044 [Trachymyrmex cornetzi]
MPRLEGLTPPTVGDDLRVRQRVTVARASTTTSASRDSERERRVQGGGRGMRGYDGREDGRSMGLRERQEYDGARAREERERGDRAEVAADGMSRGWQSTCHPRTDHRRPSRRGWRHDRRHPLPTRTVVRALNHGAKCESMQTLFLTLTCLFGKCMQVRSQAYRVPLVFRIILGPSGFPRWSYSEFKLDQIRYGPNEGMK